MSFTRFFSVVLALILPMKLSLADVIGQPRIIDGDTIEISGERIRLHGIDTPETNQQCIDGSGKHWGCGRRATFALVDLIRNQIVTCKGRKRDRYKRVIGVCFVGQQNLTAAIVRQGWALAHCKYSRITLLKRQWLIWIKLEFGQVSLPVHGIGGEVSASTPRRL